MQWSSFRDVNCKRRTLGRMSAIHPKADIAERDRDVGFVPGADIGCWGVMAFFVTSKASDWRFDFATSIHLSMNCHEYNLI
jgi:hypothetical protein